MYTYIYVICVSVDDLSVYDYDFVLCCCFRERQHVCDDLDVLCLVCLYMFLLVVVAIVCQSYICEL